MTTLSTRRLLLFTAVIGSICTGQSLPHQEAGNHGHHGEDVAPLDATAAADPIVWRKIAVPDVLLAQAGYAGDIRIGDLDGDGHVELLAYRSTAGGMKPCFLGAFCGGGQRPIVPPPSDPRLSSSSSRSASANTGSSRRPTCFGSVSGRGSPPSPTAPGCRGPTPRDTTATDLVQPGGPAARAEDGRRCLGSTAVGNCVPLVT